MGKGTVGPLNTSGTSFSQTVSNSVGFSRSDWRRHGWATWCNLQFYRSNSIGSWLSLSILVSTPELVSTISIPILNCFTIVKLVDRVQISVLIQISVLKASQLPPIQERARNTSDLAFLITPHPKIRPFLQKQSALSLIMLGEETCHFNKMPLTQGGFLRAMAYLSKQFCYKTESRIKN